jgi:hypothetical protein
VGREGRAGPIGQGDGKLGSWVDLDGERVGMKPFRWGRRMVMPRKLYGIMSDLCAPNISHIAPWIPARVRVFRECVGPDPPLAVALPFAQSRGTCGSEVKAGQPPEADKGAGTRLVHGIIG